MRLKGNKPLVALFSIYRCDMLTRDAEIELFFSASKRDAGIFLDLARSGRFWYRLGDYSRRIAHLDL
jgi:hypothetical protein